MLATLIGSSAHAGEEIIPAAAVAAVPFKNVLRLIVIASSPPRSFSVPSSVQIARQCLNFAVCAERNDFHRNVT
jgi:hypothetical protein